MNLGLLLDHPPDTDNYMLLGYGVIFGVMLLHVLSLYLRRRDLELDMEILDDVEDE